MINPKRRGVGISDFWSRGSGVWVRASPELATWRFGL